MEEKRIRRLLDQLCVELGFCLPPLEIERLCNNPPHGVVEFAEAVWVAEGFELPPDKSGLFRQVRDRVAAAFCSGEYDAP